MNFQGLLMSDLSRSVLQLLLYSQTSIDSHMTITSNNGQGMIPRLWWRCVKWHWHLEITSHLYSAGRFTCQPLLVMFLWDDPSHCIFSGCLLNCSPCQFGPCGTSVIWHCPCQILRTSGGVPYIRRLSDWLLPTTTTLYLSLPPPHWGVWSSRRDLLFHHRVSPHHSCQEALGSLQSL